MVPKETTESHVSETKCLCVNANFTGQEDEQPAKVVKKEKEDARVSQKDTEEDVNQNVATEEDEKDFPT